MEVSMSNKTIKLTVGSLEDLGKEFISTWHDAEKGKISKKDNVEKILFKDETVFFKTLTASRFALLRKLHSLGKSSIRALSKELNRDYKNVYDDVKILCSIDLILQDSDGKYYVPWESIVTEIPLVLNNKLVRKKSSIRTVPDSKKRAAG